MKRVIFLALIAALVLTLIPAAAFAAPQEGGYYCVKTHKVKRGENLSQIAVRYGVNITTLQRANNIPNRNRIYVGQRLCIPGKKPPAPQPPPGPKPPPAPGTCKYHRIQRGETLSKIANWYGVNMWALAKRNGIRNPSHIITGQVLVIYCAPAPKPPVDPPKPQPPYYPPPPKPGDPAPGCSIVPVHGFGKVYVNNPKVRVKLGCPTATEDGFNATEQVFANGRVILNNDAKQMYVIFNNGTWVQMPDTWQEGEPIYNPYLVAPKGWEQPVYGIGKMWRNEDNFSQRLGWARASQYSATATHQPYEHGKMIWTATAGIFALYDSGTWQHFN